jgi:hypothetical protein
MTAAAAERAVADLAPAEVHLLITVPNLEDQVPRAWLRYLLYSRGEDRYGGFLSGVIHNARQGRADSYFWSTEDPMLVATPWQDLVSPDHIHVITVPPGQSCVSPSVWCRLAAVIGVDHDAVELDVAAAPELTAQAAAVLRGINATASAKRLDNHAYQRWIRERLHGRVLAGTDGSPLRIPRSHLSWRTKEATDLAKQIANSGYDLLGSLDELTWFDTTVGRTNPDVLSPVELVEVEATAIADFAAELERERIAAGSFARRAARRLTRAVRHG